jgi:antitoxin CptB
MATDIPASAWLYQLRPARPGFWCFLKLHEERVADGGHSSQRLDAQRRRLLFRAWHRGMRELDLIMGRFAETAIHQLTAEELMEFEQLMEVPDHELLAWITGEVEVHAKFDSALFRRLRDFNRRGEGAR